MLVVVALGGRAVEQSVAPPGDSPAGQVDSGTISPDSNRGGPGAQPPRVTDDDHDDVVPSGGGEGGEAAGGTDTAYLR